VSSKLIIRLNLRTYIKCSNLYFSGINYLTLVSTVFPYFIVFGI